MMHSSSSVGAGPYDPGGTAEDQDTDETSPFPTTTSNPAPAQKQHDTSSPATDVQNKQKPGGGGVSQQRHHRLPSSQNQHRPEGAPTSIADACSGWCDLSVECDRTDDTAEQDDFSFAPAITAAAIVANDNHEYVQSEDIDDDDDAGGENDYVWGPQHLFLSQYSSVRNSSQSQCHGYNIYGYMYGHGAYEAATAAAVSAKNSGRHLIGTLYSHLPSRGGGGCDNDVVYAVADPGDSGDDGAGEEAAGMIETKVPEPLELPYELAPPVTVSMPRDFSNSSDGDPLTDDVISSSVHTETYIFDEDQCIFPSDKFNGDEPLFSRGASMEYASDNMKSISENGDSSYTGTHGYGEEVALTGTSLACDSKANEELLHSPQHSHIPVKPEIFTQESENDDGEYFYIADEQMSTLRSEVVEVLQEDITRVNEAFLDTLHKTSALVQPIAAAASRQSGSTSPVRQRLSAISETAIGLSRSVSERADSTGTSVAPARQSIRQMSIRLWNKAHEAEEKLVHAAHKAEKSAISTAGEAISQISQISHIHVSGPSMNMPKAIAAALESAEAVVEELRVIDVDIQSGVNDAELLSQMTAGAYA